MKPKPISTASEELRAEIKRALHIDWAFKDVHGKPDKIIVQGYPKGAYHTSYKQFEDNVLALFEAQRTRIELEAKIYGLMQARKYKGNEFEVAQKIDKQVARYESQLTALDGREEKL